VAKRRVDIKKIMATIAVVFPVSILLQFASVRLALKYQIELARSESLRRRIST